jgi:hypothetical protein
VVFGHLSDVPGVVLVDLVEEAHGVLAEEPYCPVAPAQQPLAASARPACSSSSTRKLSILILGSNFV